MTRDDPPRQATPDEALVGDALRALSAEAEPRPGPDAGRVAAHFAGVGDDDLLRDAAADPAVRALLAEIAQEAGDIEGAVAAETGPSSETLVAARQAFGGGAPGDRNRGWGGWARADGGRWLRVAALVLLALVPVAWLAAFLGPTAEAGFEVAGIDRVAADGTVVAEGPRRLAPGERVRGAADERVALRLAGGAAVVLPDGGAVVLASDDAPAFILEAPIAWVTGPQAGGAAPARVALPRVGRLEVASGTVRVRGWDGGALLDALEGSRAAWTPYEGARDAWTGPAVRRVGRPSPSGDPAEDRRADSGFAWGGPATPPTYERLVGARQWRVLSAPGPFERVAAPEGVPVLRAGVAPARPLRLAWAPDPDARGAAALSVRLSAVGVGLGPVRLRVAVEGVDGASAVVPAAPEPFETRVALPEGWGEAFSARELVVVVACEDGAADVSFRGVVFGPSPPSGVSPDGGG